MPCPVLTYRIPVHSCAFAMQYLVLTSGITLLAYASAAGTGTKDIAMPMSRTGIKTERKVEEGGRMRRKGGDKCRRRGEKRGSEGARERGSARRGGWGWSSVEC
eukprot:3429412-Rhodomonas_salina.1